MEFKENLNKTIARNSVEKARVQYRPYYIYKRGKRYKRSGYGRMDNNIYNILWTLIWLTFVAGLCLFFDNAWSLILLLLWMSGFKTK